MNIEEARNVLWLRNNPRPLGELLDLSEVLSEKQRRTKEDHGRDQ